MASAAGGTTAGGDGDAPLTAEPGDEDNIVAADGLNYRRGDGVNHALYQAREAGGIVGVDLPLHFLEANPLPEPFFQLGSVSRSHKSHLGTEWLPSQSLDQLSIFIQKVQNNLLH